MPRSVWAGAAYRRGTTRPVTRIGFACLAVAVLVIGARPGLAASAVDLPDWQPGDWFRLEFSWWQGGSIPDEYMQWGPPYAVLLTVLEPESFRAHECHRLRLTQSRDPDGPACIEYLTADRGLRVLRQEYAGGAPPVLRHECASAPAPAWVNFDEFPFPGFPLVAGEVRAFREAEPARTDASASVAGKEAQRYIIPCRVLNLRQSVSRDPGWPDALRVVLGNDSEGHCIIRWLPGKPWWVQAWWIGRGGGKSYYRAALQGTSWDTPPPDELSTKLPQEIAGWQRQQPEVVRIPKDGKGLTSYTKAAQVAWSKGDARVTMWFVPLRFDTIYEEAEEGSPPRARTMHEGDNYRVVLWEPSETEQAETALLSGLHEALAAYPEATLDEYRLPKAAPGGKILEDAG